MVWQTIIDAASLEALQAATPTIADIPAGSPVKVLLDFSWPSWVPLADIANLASAELWVPALAGVRDFTVTDVHANSGNQIEIDGIAQGLDSSILAAALTGALLGTAIAPGPGTAIGFGVGALIGFVYSAYSAYMVARVRIQADITRQAEVQQATEAARENFVATYVPTLGYQATLDLLNGVTKPTVEQVAANPSLWDDLKKAIAPAVSIGGVILVGALIFFGMQYLPKPKQSVA